LAWDRAARVVVRLWTAAINENRAPRWTVWFGQPFKSSRDPFEIVEAEPPDSYVMFVLSPSVKVRRLTNACLVFHGRSDNAGKVHFHSVQ